MTLEQKRMDKLYQLLRRLDAEHSEDTAAALRWAIFNLEREFPAWAISP